MIGRTQTFIIQQEEEATNQGLQQQITATIEENSDERKPTAEEKNQRDNIDSPGRDLRPMRRQGDTKLRGD